MNPGRQKFQRDDEFKRGVMKWLGNQNKTFRVTGFSNLPGQQKNILV
jgi:hypothetical protein